MIDASAAAELRERLSGIADELYALAPAEFTAVRNTRATGARSDGHTDLAKAIAALARPAAAAWVVNMLVRRHREEVDKVLDLGAELREAQAGLDRAALTRLMQQRRHLVSSATKLADDLARSLGHPINPATITDVRLTLQAAMADADAAGALRTGRLLRALGSVGFDPVDLAGAVAIPVPGGGAPATSAKPHKASDPGADPHDAAALDATRAAARRELVDAESLADDAEAELRAAERQADGLSRRRETLVAERSHLEERFAEVERDRALAEADLGDARDRRQGAARAADAARRAADRAREHLNAV